MAVDLIKNHKSYVATNAIAAQFVFVKVDPNNAFAVILPNANDYCIGVQQDKPAAGDPCMVCGPGDLTKVLCGGTIAIGQDVMTDGSGQAVAGASGGYILGTAVSAGASGFLCDIIYQPRGARGVA